MSGTENHIPPLPFQELVARLRDRGFIIGVEHHLRLSLLLDRIGWECSPSELKMLLGPIFARSEAEQEEFHRIFDELYPGFDPGPHQPAPSSSSASSTSSSTPAPKPKSRLPLMIAGIVLLLVLAAVLYMALQDDEKKSDGPGRKIDTGRTVPSDPGGKGDTGIGAGRPHPAVPDTVPSGPGDTIGQKKKDTTTPAGNDTGPPRNPDTSGRDSAGADASASSDGLPGPLWLAVIIPPLYVLTRELHRYGLRRRQKERVQGRKLPYAVSIALDRRHPVIYTDDDFHDLARAMRRRHAAEGVRLDVEASVAATIGALGYPTFRYRHTSQVPEYLFLIDRSSPRDHQAMLHRELAIALEREGVFVASYWYDGDPRLCWSIESGETVTVEELHARHGHRRLLIFGEGRGLLDQETGRLKSWAHFFAYWSERGLMTPANPRRWGREERTLATEFAVYPAHLMGMRTFMEHLGDAVPLNLRRWMQAEPSVPDDLRGAGVLPVLRRYLGPDLFRWLCACAVYPELHWDLTLHLGALPCMQKGLITERNVQMLARLEWFRAGSIPDDIRWLLMRELPHDAMRMVRRAIVDILAKNPPPEGTFAENDYELKQATQQWLLDHDRRSLRHLLHLISISPKSDIRRDRTLARFLRRDARRPWDAILPAKLHDVVYTYGIPRLGLRTPVRMGMMLGLAAVAAGVIWAMMPDTLVPPEPVPPKPGPTPVIPKGPILPPPVPDKNDTTKKDSTGSDSVLQVVENNPGLEGGTSESSDGSNIVPEPSSTTWKEEAVSRYQSLGGRLNDMDRQILSEVKNDSVFSDFKSRIDALRTIVNSQIAYINEGRPEYDSARVWSDIEAYSDNVESLQRFIDEYSQDMLGYGPPTILTSGEPYIFNISPGYLSYTTPRFRLGLGRKADPDLLVIPVEATPTCDDCAEFDLDVALRKDGKDPFSWQATITARSYDIVMKRGKELNGRRFKINLRLDSGGEPTYVSFTITTQVQ